LILQVYPSVEYDFTPNALALSTNDMIHFQWTGSDYNPRRGCNDATGGPPDANTFSTDANANNNARADRSNIVFTNHMAQNVPKDYLGYNHLTTTMNYTAKMNAAKNTVLQNAPCYDPAKDTHATANECYNTMMRLAYLNQQLDGGSLVLRAGNKCLTQTQLDAIADQDTARTHPLNCAKMNAKPFPYFNGGLMMMRKAGWFPFYSSRNNNFSNRQNIGVICVGQHCKLMNGTGVLQDNNPAVSGNALVRAAASACQDTANGGQGSNANGATSCLTTATGAAAILTTETFTVTEGDNDMKGDGNIKGCSVMTYSVVGTKTVEQQVALAIILLFVGLFAAWLAYYLYNRYQASQPDASKFRYDASWQTTSAEAVAGSTSKAVEMKSNPGAASTTTYSFPDAPSPPKPPLPSRGPGGSKAVASPSASISSPPKPAAKPASKPGRIMSTKRSARPKHEEMI
jgi:hypothetical protein